MTQIPYSYNVLPVKNRVAVGNFLVGQQKNNCQVSGKTCKLHSHEFSVSITSYYYKLIEYGMMFCWIRNLTLDDKIIRNAKHFGVKRFIDNVWMDGGLGGCLVRGHCNYSLYCVNEIFIWFRIIFFHGYWWNRRRPTTGSRNGCQAASPIQTHKNVSCVDWGANSESLELYWLLCFRVPSSA